MQTQSPIQQLVGAGYECYVVGGALRDLLLGQPPKDFDLLTSATPKQVSPAALHWAASTVQQRAAVSVVMHQAGGLLAY